MTDHEAPELIAHIVERGLSQNQVAHLMDVNKGMISSWLSGRRRPSPENLIRLRELAEQAGQPPGDGNGLATDLEVARRLEAQRAESEASDRAVVEAEVAAEREDAAKLEAVRRDVEQARSDAAAIHVEAATVAEELRVSLGAVVGNVRRLQELAALLRKACHVESWHARNTPGVVQRVTIGAQLPVPRLAPAAFKLAQVLSEVAGGDAGSDRLKADQTRSWDALL